MNKGYTYIDGKMISSELEILKLQIEKEKEILISLQEEKTRDIELKNETKTSTYVPSNDSENIATLLDGFEYNQNKTDEILAKYKDLEKTAGPVKSLRPKNK